MSVQAPVIREVQAGDAVGRVRECSVDRDLNRREGERERVMEVWS